MRAASILIVVSITSHAAAEPDSYVERPLAMSAHVGAGTPLGFYGFAAELAVRRELSLEAGVGRGLVGTQLAAQARVRVAAMSPTTQLAFGAGLSTGHYEHRDPFYGIEYAPTVVDRAYWSNGEVSIERRSTASGALQLRGYVGVGMVVAGERERCYDGDAGTVMCSGSAGGLWNPYVGLALGYAFGR